jgi:hypothetical protein
MRRAARTDASQKDIVDALRKIGVQVVVSSQVGDGFPDLICYLRRVFFLECKDGEKPPSGRRLTVEQVKFHDWWRGELHVVCSVEEAINACIHGDINGTGTGRAHVRAGREVERPGEEKRDATPAGVE